MVKVLSLMAIILFSFSCANQAEEQNTTQQTKKQFDVHQSSEMALLMRKMESVLKATKDSIQSENNYASLDFNMEQLLTATVFDPSKKGPAFDGFAHNFLEQISALENAKPEEREKIFNATVNTCITCHQAFCPGPIVTIKKLKIQEKPL